MKKLTYEQAKRRADEMADGLGKPVEHGIKELVISLWMLGIETSSSCEGHVEQRLPYPWVFIAPESRDRAMREIMASNLRNLDGGGKYHQNVWVFHPFGKGRHLRITPWDVKRPLSELQADALELAMYLRQNC